MWLDEVAVDPKVTVGASALYKEGVYRKGPIRRGSFNGFDLFVL